jgi:hypothetical protein
MDIYMRPEDEELLADGRNWEHSEGAIKTTELEIHFRVESQFKNAIDALIAGNQVFNIIIFFFHA